MGKFSEPSSTRLATCDERLQRLFNEVVKHFDCTVISGHRGEKEQNEAFAKGFSKLRYPNSKHNRKPSLAADVVPFPIDWKDTNRMRVFAGFVLGIASQMEIKIRWGGDWDSDTEVKDNSFQDLPHFEIAEKR